MESWESFCSIWASSGDKSRNSGISSIAQWQTIHEIHQCSASDPRTQRRPYGNIRSLVHIALLACMRPRPQHYHTMTVFIWFLIHEFVGFNVFIVYDKDSQLEFDMRRIKKSISKFNRSTNVFQLLHCVLFQNRLFSMIYSLFYQKNLMYASISTWISILDGAVVPIWSQFYKTVLICYHPSLLINLKSKGHLHRYKLHHIF